MNERTEEKDDSKDFVSDMRFRKVENDRKPSSGEKAFDEVQFGEKEYDEGRVDPSSKESTYEDGSNLCRRLSTKHETRTDASVLEQCEWLNGEKQNRCQSPRNQEKSVRSSIPFKPVAHSRSLTQVRKRKRKCSCHS